MHRNEYKEKIQIKRKILNLLPLNCDEFNQLSEYISNNVNIINNLGFDKKKNVRLHIKRNKI